MAKQRKEVAALSAIIAFFVMHATINSLLILDGTIVNDVVSSRVLDGSITWVCGLQSLEMGVFGGIIVGLGVSALHNRFYQIQLPSIISFLKANDLCRLSVPLLIYLWELYCVLYGHQSKWKCIT